MRTVRRLVSLCTMIFVLLVTTAPLWAQATASVPTPPPQDWTAIINVLLGSLGPILVRLLPVFKSIVPEPYSTVIGQVLGLVFGWVHGDLTGVLEAAIGSGSARAMIAIPPKAAAA